MAKRPAIIHCGGLMPPSFGPAKTWCGRRLPVTPEHFDILGMRRPDGARRCKVCQRKLEERTRRCGACRRSGEGDPMGPEYPGLTCDECGRKHEAPDHMPEHVSGSDVARDARRVGWRQRAGGWFCPRCLAKAERSETAGG